MPLGETIVKKLSKKFPPSTTVTMKVGQNDLSIITDENGNAVQLFMGKAGINGIIKGDRYTRTLKLDGDGRVIKDHWERKGKAT